MSTCWLWVVPAHDRSEVYFTKKRNVSSVKASRILKVASKNRQNNTKSDTNIGFLNTTTSNDEQGFDALDDTFDDISLRVMSLIEFRLIFCYQKGFRRMRNWRRERRIKPPIDLICSASSCRSSTPLSSSSSFLPPVPLLQLLF